MKLRFKILFGFLVLTSMLLIAGVMSILEFSSISDSVQDLLEDNYKSVNASKEMIEALEREDSGVLLLLLGKYEEGRSTLSSADSIFNNAFEIAKNNITIQNEQGYVSEVERKYLEFKKHWERPIVGTEKEGNINWYTQEVHPSFLQTKSAVKKLMTLNDSTMYATATTLQSKAKRSIMPGIVAIASAVLFALMFSFFVNLYVITPIIKMTKGIKDFLQYKKSFNIEVETNDEIADLSHSLKNLINTSSKAK